MILKAKMESIHGIDVSWIHNTHNKGEGNSEGRGVCTGSFRLGGDDFWNPLLTSLFGIDHPRHPKTHSPITENATPVQNGTKSPQTSTNVKGGSCYTTGADITKACIYKERVFREDVDHTQVRNAFAGYRTA
jgi:hypothetical protein